jgi:hypothetical protein
LADVGYNLNNTVLASEIVTVKGKSFHGFVACADDGDDAKETPLNAAKDDALDIDSGDEKGEETVFLESGNSEE